VIAAAADGNLWFTLGDNDALGRITVGGRITQFSGMAAGTVPLGIAAGPDGDLWFTGLVGDSVGRFAMGLPLDAPLVTGLPQVGRRLACAPGIWTNVLTALGRQWRRDGVAIPGATGATYTTVAADLGHSVNCRVTAEFTAVLTPIVSESAGVLIGATETGPRGQAGPPGPAGPISCTAKRAGRKIKVSCKLKAKSAVARRALRRGANAVRGSRIGARTVSFTTARAPHGDYTITIRTPGRLTIYPVSFE
jgi:hypothetical protein